MEAPRQKHVFVGQMFQADAFYKTHQGQQQLDGAIDSDRLKSFRILKKIEPLPAFSNVWPEVQQ